MTEKRSVFLMHPKLLQSYAILGVRAEIAKLTALLAELEKAAFVGQPAFPERKPRKPMSAARRAAQSKRMKAFWKAKRSA